MKFLIKITWFLSFSSKNDAESLCHFVKIQFLDPKRAKLDQNSDFSHVRTYFCHPGGQVLVSKAGFCFYFFRFMIFYQSHMFYWANLRSLNKFMCFTKQNYEFYYCWLHKLRNTQGKIPPCTWNISRKHIWNISGLYKEYP